MIVLVMFKHRHDFRVPLPCERVLQRHKKPPSQEGGFSHVRKSGLFHQQAVEAVGHAIPCDHVGAAPKDVEGVDGEEGSGIPRIGSGNVLL